MIATDLTFKLEGKQWYLVSADREAWTLPHKRRRHQGTAGNGTGGRTTATAAKVGRKQRRERVREAW
jgi:hypothetical protein